MSRERQTHAVGRAADLPEGSHVVVEVGRRELGIFNVGGRFYALPNVCFHQSGPLCRGRLGDTLVASEETGWQPEWAHEGEIIVCPWHLLEFNVTSGQCLSHPDRRLPVYEVRDVDGMLEVLL